MTLTFERDLDSVKLNQQTKNLGRFVQQLLNRHTPDNDCSARITSVVGK